MRGREGGRGMDDSSCLCIHTCSTSGFYLEKYFWGGSVLQCNEYNSLLQKYTLCRGSGRISPRKFSDLEVTFDAI